MKEANYIILINYHRSQSETIFYFDLMERDDGDKNFRRDKGRYETNQTNKEVKKKKYKLKDSDVFAKAEQESISNLQKDMTQTLKKVEQTEKKYGEYRESSQSQVFKMKEEPREQYRRYEQPRRERQRQGRNPRNQNYRREQDKEDRDWQERRRGGHNRGRQRGGHKPNYVEREKKNNDNPCSKYMRDAYVLQKDSFGLDDKIKKLRKLFKEQFKDAHKIQVYASKTYPMIYFQYMENQTSKKPTQMILREVFKKISTLREKRSLFQVIFERVFLKVPNKFHRLAIFAIEKAKNIKVNLNRQSIFNLEEGSDVMFYYLKGNQKQKVINFTLFDRALRSFQFNSNFIEGFEEEHPDQYESFQKFQNQVFQQERQGQGVDIMLNEEMSSDEDDKGIFQQRTLPQLRKEVYKIANKDISDLQEIIDKKYDQMVAEAHRDTQSDRFKRLEQQHQDLTENRDNFINTRNSVAQKLEKHKEDKAILKICLKKLIIAEKQLQSRLPIVAKKRKIFEMLRRQNLLIIEGETGSGKSTQLPQMLCEYYDLFQNDSAKPVLVTQPRRLATRTLAQRVAKEMGEEVGGFVDYIATGGRRVSKEAKIIFKLDRLVLDEITEDNLLSNYSCLVIDQAHERTISIDVILGLVKELLTKRKDFKVIVTSASMDIQLFQSYFGTKTLKVSGRTFPVTIKYKNYEKYKEGDKYQMVHKIRKVIDEQILFDSSSMKSEFKGHVLCFCSSVDQITELVKFYDGKLNKRVFDVFALHGKVTPADQKKAFEDTGKHKFIFASRIAETAITIDGVRVVIDPGQDIELVFDQKYKVSSMKLQDITQSSAKQRAGRSGRTGPGHCFRLYSEQNFKKRKANKIPEIKNSSLQTVVLRLKTLKIHDVIAFPYIERPDINGLRRSLDLLKMIGALEPNTQKVSKIGELLIKLPIQPFLSRAIIEGLMFDKILRNDAFRGSMKLMPQPQMNITLQRGVINTVIQILSMLINFSNLFFIKKQDREKGQQAKYSEFSDQDGDFFFLDNIYRKYSQLKKKVTYTGKGCKGSNSELNKWIKQKFLNFKALGQINELVEEITKIIQGYTVSEKQYENELDTVKIKLRECKTYRQVILSCLITSFSANLCKFSGNEHVGYTIVNQRRPIQIYGTSNLSLLGIKADWIICYDLYTNEEGKFYCKLAHKVDYAFMNKHIDKYVWKKFDIEAIQYYNPYYTELTCDLPTKYIQKIKFDFNKCDTDPQFQFLRGLFPSIAQETNKVSFFLQNALKNDKEEEKKVEEKRLQLNKYLTKIHHQNNQPFRHNYIGNIYISLKNGFQISNVQFSNKQFCIEIIAPNNSVVQMIEIDSKAWGQPFIEDIVAETKNDRKGYYAQKVPQVIQKKKIKVYFTEQQNKKAFISYLVLLNDNLTEFKLEFKQSLVDKRRKIPQTKILLHYFAGTCLKDNLLISYSSYQNSPDAVETVAETQLQLIKDALYKKKKRRQESIMNPLNMHTTKNKTGINVYRCDYDEYELLQELFEMDKANLLTHKFKFPSFVKRFREPEISEARKTNEDWKEQIIQLLEKVNIKMENVTINIRGFYQPDKRRGEVTTVFDRSLRVDMNATITTLDTTVFKKLKDNYDGRRKILGCQKTHVRVIYEQIITICAQRTFQSLEEEFRHYTIDYKIKYPLMSIEQISFRTRNKPKIMIKARSSKREDFLEPQRVISKLFTPKLIKLQASEFRFINRMDAGNRILEMIEDEYDLKIYFGMQRINHSLKVYCEDADLKDIQAKVKDQIKKFKFYSQRISYRGKNLNKVKEALEALKANLGKNQQLSYQIIFQQRKIQLTADLGTFEKVKNEILKLTNSDKKECLICADIMRNPYRFINCTCSFCWLCITDHIRTFRNNISQQILQCPNDQCKKPVSVFDVRTLMTQEEFQKICDIKISKYIQKNSTKYVACKYCQNFFDKQEVESAGVIECQICGKSECLKCKEYHPNYNCEDWKNRNNIKSQLKSLGVKQCPKCNSGIQKNGGCNHMECTNCHAHICWKCLKTFADSKLCYDHLAKQCGGIFDAQ